MNSLIYISFSVVGHFVSNILYMGRNIMKGIFAMGDMFGENASSLVLGLGPRWDYRARAFQNDNET